MANRDGAFSLAIVENSEGLIVRAPSPAAPAAVGE
jgi:hypothetical protein